MVQVEEARDGPMEWRVLFIYRIGYEYVLDGHTSFCLSPSCFVYTSTRVRSSWRSPRIVYTPGIACRLSFVRSCLSIDVWMQCYLVRLVCMVKVSLIHLVE